MIISSLKQFRCETMLTYDELQWELSTGWSRSSAADLRVQTLSYGLRWNLCCHRRKRFYMWSVWIRSTNTPFRYLLSNKMMEELLGMGDFAAECPYISISCRISCRILKLETNLICARSAPLWLNIMPTMHPF